MVNSDLRRILELSLKHGEDISNLFKREGGKFFKFLLKLKVNIEALN